MMMDGGFDRSRKIGGPTSSARKAMPSGRQRVSDSELAQATEITFKDIKDFFVKDGTVITDREKALFMASRRHPDHLTFADDVPKFVRVMVLNHVSSTPGKTPWTTYSNMVSMLRAYYRSEDKFQTSWEVLALLYEDNDLVTPDPKEVSITIEAMERYALYRVIQTTIKHEKENEKKRNNTD